jgi:phospholipid/cholesterol/gamma-HCH transport system permease protein
VITPRLVAAVVGPVGAVGRFGGFAADAALAAVQLRWSLSEAIRHAGILAMRCLVPVCATIFPFGAVIAVQGMVIFDLFGAHRLLSSLLAVVIIRELGPVLAAVLVAAQGGSSFAAELGAMRIQEELDATAVMAVDPLGWHVVPRILAMTLVVPVLTILADAMGVFGGYVVAVGLYDQDHGVFMAHLIQLISLFDLFASVLKGLVFGVVIGLIATFRGYCASGGAEGVGRAVNDTVVYSVMSILVLNYVLSSALFAGGP